VTSTSVPSGNGSSVRTTPPLTRPRMPRL
jgi:hypothetical protein